ncbi:hypothetical protein EHS25_003920 [Saitozyma podzolica]|uniref:DUF567 domain protein n=1 Tax=Saitozyma podzolica TaxID=1890683 RepID=A0A427Y3W9_9TREE|nr:hypothetical protein EHS25_003920 [Saitozyma podzolica]
MGILDYIHTRNATLGAVPAPVAIHTSMCRSEPTTLALRDNALSASGDVTDARSGAILLRVKTSKFTLHERKSIVDIHDKTLFTIVDESMMDSLLPTSVGKMVGRTYVGHDENGKEVFKVHKNLSVGSNLTINFVQNGQVRHLILVGDVWSGNSNIRLDDGTPVAHIDRHVSPSGSNAPGASATIPVTAEHLPVGGNPSSAMSNTTTTSVAPTTGTASSVAGAPTAAAPVSPTGAHVTPVSPNDKHIYYLSVAPGVDLSLMAVVALCLNDRINESDSNDGML